MFVYVRECAASKLTMQSNTTIKNEEEKSPNDQKESFVCIPPAPSHSLSDLCTDIEIEIGIRYTNESIARPSEV